MKKALTVVVGLLALVGSSFASVISGSMKWYTGTLDAAITIASTTQSVDVKVGTTTKTFTCLVPGAPGTSCPAGTAVTVLESGSSPFIGTFVTGSDLVALPELSGTSGAATTRRLVPLSTAGETTDNVAFVNPYGTSTNAGLLVPPCTVGTIDFLGGVTLNMLVGLTSYSITEPTTTAATLGSVAFPAGYLSPNSVVGQFNGNGILAIIGSSATSTDVPVSAIFEVGTLTKCTLATLNFTTATTPIG